MAFTSDTQSDKVLSKWFNQCIPKESQCLGPTVIERAKMGSRLEEFCCIVYITHTTDGALLKCHFSLLLIISYTLNNRFSLKSNVLNITFVHGLVR